MTVFPGRQEINRQLHDCYIADYFEGGLEGFYDEHITSTGYTAPSLSRDVNYFLLTRFIFCLHRDNSDSHRLLRNARPKIQIVSDKCFQCLTGSI
jgi:hypothetical protein